jgi:hypothetical protein
LNRQSVRTAGWAPLLRRVGYVAFVGMLVAWPAALYIFATRAPDFLPFAGIACVVFLAVSAVVLRSRVVWGALMGAIIGNFVTFLTFGQQVLSAFIVILMIILAAIAGWWFEQSAHASRRAALPPAERKAGEIDRGE